MTFSHLLLLALTRASIKSKTFILKISNTLTKKKYFFSLYCIEYNNNNKTINKLINGLFWDLGVERFIFYSIFYFVRVASDCHKYAKLNSMNP